MKNKISNTLSDMSTNHLSLLRSLSSSHPELRGEYDTLQNKLLEFNRRYYRPNEDENIVNLYDEVMGCKGYADYTIRSLKRKYDASRKRKKSKSKVNRKSGKKCRCKK